MIFAFRNKYSEYGLYIGGKQKIVILIQKKKIIGKGKGNIFTANGSVKYRFRNFDADINAKYIVAGQNYAGADVKLAYKTTR